MTMNVGFKAPVTLGSESTGRSLDLRTYLNFLWRNWMFISAILALSLLVGVVYLIHATPLYTSTVQILIEPQQEKITSAGGDLVTSQVYNFAMMESQLSIINSDPLLRRVVMKEQLATPPQTDTPLNEDEKSAEAQRIQDAISRLRGALRAKRLGESTAFDISITWPDPKQAARLANAVAEAYIVDQLDTRLEAAKRTSGWLSDRIVELRKQLRESEEAVAQFRKDNGLLRSGPNVTLNEQQLSELNSKLVAARTEAAEKKSRVEYLDDVLAGKKTLDALPDTLQTGNMMSALRTKLTDVSQRQADLLARYSSRHPAVINIEAEKRDIERSISAEAQRMAQTVRSEYSLAKAREGAFEQAMREATGQGGLDSEAGIRLRELERTAAVNKTLFEEFLQKAKISDERSTFQTRDVRIVMPAQPGGKSFPNDQRVLTAALLLGLAIGIGGAFLIEMLNHGFTTPRQVEDLLKLPVLASIRTMNDGERTKGKRTLTLPHYQIEQPLSAFSEAMRTLRSGIHMLDVDRPPKFIHVTSTRPGEGKTTIAMSLAISAALSGLKVVLVDADLRHPSVTRFFKLEKEKGLVDLLTGGSINDSMFRKDGVAIIPAGSQTMNPSDILSSERMKLLVNYLKENFDYVVMDSPPVGPVVDPIILSDLADKSIFVVQWASTPRDLVENCVKKISTQKRVGGIVLNLVKQSRAKKYGSEYHYGDRYYAKYYSGESREAVRSDMRGA
jgi:polysaccharide biosynthesis transport protein